MKINPVNYKIPTNKYLVQKNTKSSNLGVLKQNSVAFESRIPESLKNEYIEKKVYEAWISKLSNPTHALIGKKIALYNLGIELGEKMCRKFTITQIDLTDSIAKLRDKMLERNFEFSLSTNWLTENKNLNAINYILEHYDKISYAIRNLGLDTVIYGLGMKQQRFEILLNDLDRYISFAPNSHIELLTELTNPTMTQHYRYLENEKNKLSAKMHGEENDDFSQLHRHNKRLLNILQHEISIKKSEKDTTAVKKLYQTISKIRQEEIAAKPINIKELEKEMTKIKAEINQFSSKGLKDPQKKIELFYMYKNLPCIDDIQKLNQIYLADKSKNSPQILNQFLSEKLSEVYDLTPNEQSLLDALEIQESPYFTRLFQAAPQKNYFALGVEVNTQYLQKGFYDNFKKMLTRIASSPEFKDFQKGEINIEECLQKVFNKLPQNIRTREMFKEKKLDFDSWATYNSERDELEIDKHTVIRKVNMNNLKHSLFLGNQACCCTAVGTGSRAGSAASYPMNQFVQAIELLVDGDVVGNTMCYFADVEASCYPQMITKECGEIVIIENPKENKLALIIDNLEILKPYKLEEKYLNAFILYAEKLIKNIGGDSDIAIYAGHRNSFSMNNYKKASISRMYLIGDSCNDTLSLDSISNLAVINDTIDSNKIYYGNFYSIKP